MTTNYYGCLSGAHQEFNCLAAQFHRKGWAVEKWCQPCRDRYEASYHQHLEGRPE